MKGSALSYACSPGQIIREMGVQRAEGLAAVHLLQIFAFPTGDPAETASLTEGEKARIQRLESFRAKAGYNHIHSTRPQTLAYGLADSPAGLEHRAIRPVR